MHFRNNQNGEVYDSDEIKELLEEFSKKYGVPVIPIQ